MRALLLLVIGGLLWDCNSEKKQDLFSAGTALGRVPQRLEEASGLVASMANPGLLWTVNDSGNPAEIFLIDQHANIRLVCTLGSVHNRDWEDVAIGKGPVPGKNYIYVAEIGDNEARYELKYIYRFEEPMVGIETEITITQFDTLILRMPDGKRDTETILIDPFTNDLYMISKREQSVALYKTPYPFSHDTVTLQKAMTLPYTKIIAGSISSDGLELLLKDYDHVYYWKRTPEETLPDLLTKKPLSLAYEREPQGEAIAWSRDGNEYYTLSEGSKEERANLFVYKRKR